MPSLHQAKARDEIVERIRRFSPKNTRRWGHMEPEQALCHLGDGLRIALGDIPTRPPNRGPMRFAPLRFLLVYVLPWPKGKAKAPEAALTTTATGWEEDRAALLELIDRFVQTPADRLAATHPLFGKMTGRDWTVLSHRHLDHHLRQFGV